MTYDKHDHGEMYFDKLSSSRRDVHIEWDTHALAKLDAWKQEVIRHAVDQLEKMGLQNVDIDPQWKEYLDDSLSDSLWAETKRLKDNIEACGGVA